MPVRAAGNPSGGSDASWSRVWERTNTIDPTERIGRLADLGTAGESGVPVPAQENDLRAVEPAGRPTEPSVQVARTRRRQTPAEARPLRELAAGGANVLLTGAEIALHAVGGPLLAAAVHGPREDVVAGIRGEPPGGSGAGAPATGDSAAGALNPELAQMHAMQRESQRFNLQLLELQEVVQKENRRFTVLSNVVRARHDTAKAAVSNIRS